MAFVRYREAMAAVLAAASLGLGSGVVAAGSVPPAAAPDDTAAGGTVPGDTVPATEPIDEGGGTIEGGDPGADAPSATLPLIPVPPSCPPAPVAHVVFLGTVIDRDFRTIRYRVDQVRDGTTAPFAAPGGRGGTGEVIDVRYGLDVQHLDDGRQYLVGAHVDPVLGVLVSRVRPKVENFGGDEVIGVSETDVDCPAFDDPAMTLHPDGTPVDGSMFRSFFDAKWRIVGAVVTPFAIACAVLFVLSALRLSITGALRGIWRLRPRRLS